MEPACQLSEDNLISYFHSQLTGKSSPEQDILRSVSDRHIPPSLTVRTACDDTWLRPDIFQNGAGSTDGDHAGASLPAEDPAPDVPARHDRLMKLQTVIGSFILTLQSGLGA